MSQLADNIKILKHLKPQAKIHMMGICGTAMASLAGLLQAKGFQVKGSDANPYPPMSIQLKNLNIEIQKGYSAENLSYQPDFVIVGNVISASNPEAQEVLRLNLPYTSLPQAMGELIFSNCDSIVIAGTHGKTTTTSMMSWVAENQNLKPGFMIGGIPRNFNQSFRNPDGKYFIIEGDEYDTAYFDKVPKFIHYKPKHVILTSIEFDHADIYADLDAVKAAFKELLVRIPEDGTLVYSAEDENIKSLLGFCKAKRKISYGFKAGDYQASIRTSNKDKISFSIQKNKSELCTLNMSISGNYNVLNATAVLAMADQLDWSKEQTIKGLESFSGVKRRQEILGEPDGVLIIEDFAHHPTAVRETIKGIQSKYEGRKFFSVFEPRSATSRRKVFQKEYVEAFKSADEVILARAFDQSKIDSEDRFSSEELILDLQKLDKKAHVFDSADAIVKYLVKESKSGDGILIMSNGGFDGIYQKLMDALKLRKENP